MTKTIAALCIALTAISARAQIASDIASNYGSSWTNLSNGGSGFLPWLISANSGGGGFAGTFIGSSTDGAGNINTSGSSFGLYANPATASVAASRAFAVSLTNGNVFSFQMALNFDNGNKGFSLFAGSQGQVFNFNVGGGGAVSTNNGAVLNSGSGTGYNYGGNNAVINVSISVASGNAFAYSISRTSEQGFQGTLFSGSVSSITEPLSGFEFYVNNTDNGLEQNNLYVNNLTVVPEPSSIALLLFGAIVVVGRKRLVLQSRYPSNNQPNKHSL